MTRPDDAIADLFGSADRSHAANPIDGDELALERQMRLTQVQLFNWGTFAGYLALDIAPEGYLFVGPSGSGKSTILDAHALLTTPPKWVDFNVAARENERRGRDRNVLTYVRGAWAQQTTDGGEHAAQFLRPGTTWSAVAETYRSADGEVVVLCALLWVKGKGTAATDARRLNLVLQRPLDLRELKVFPEHDFDVRRLKAALPDAFVTDEFGAYQERFRRLLGIDSERALRLLHKTQSAKNLGDLDEFMRDFMLDPPTTFRLADTLVEQFTELNEAHRAVVAARRQIEILTPAREHRLAHDRAALERNALDELAVGMDAYAEQLRERLLRAAVDTEQTRLQGLRDAAERCAAEQAQTHAGLLALERQRGERGGDLLALLQVQQAQAESERHARVQRRERLRADLQALHWPVPDTPQAFADLQAQARAELAEGVVRREQANARRDALAVDLAQANERFAATRREVEALQRQRSSIPAPMLDLRDEIARELALDPAQLPFTGELIDVRDEAADWRGAIERVLRGFGMSLLVDDRHYARVADWLDTHHTGRRLVYFRTRPRDEARRTEGARRTPGPASLARKLRFAPGAQGDWVRQEIESAFDYECADTLQAFRAASRAVTRQGQVKHGPVRHEKDDRRPLDDRSQWVLGFDNAAKLELVRRHAQQQAEALAALQAERNALASADSVHDARTQACIRVAGAEWSQVDVAGAAAQLQALAEQIALEQASRPELADLDRALAAQREADTAALQRRSHADARVQAARDELARLSREIDRLRGELLSVTLTPLQREGLDARFGALAETPAPGNVDALARRVDRELGDSRKDRSLAMQALARKIEDCFAAFAREWPADTGGLDPVMASADDFLAKLARLERDGLPRHEDRFFALLREHSEQNLVRLHAQLDQERKAIRDRMALVNDSLATAQFGHGTHLVIDVQDRTLPDVAEFRQLLRASLSDMFSAERDVAERRFQVIQALVRRLASPDTPDRNWRSLVLDVRQHVGFVARELDELEREVEVYRSGAGKSGGQRQKLAATCLAAALRYQLGGQDRALPRFATVFLDEAFDKADAEFTEMAMNIFRTFGFQMVVATPLKSVMTLERFIGGACFVHIRDRKDSRVITIDYDHESERLRLDPQLRADAECDDQDAPDAGDADT